MGDPGSTALLLRARAGSADALNELYARFGPRLLSLIRLRMGPGLRPETDSRDILQATLLKSFQRLDQFAGADGRSLMGWLARIAENEIRDRADRQGRQRRDKAREEPLDTALAVSAHVRTAVSQLIVDEEADRLERAIAKLEEPHREAILLRKFEELSYAEMAGRLGRSEDACRMLVARAMVALTLLLQESP
jgi:RNA polymerase sigma-70 factor (ECF subfamily)